MSTAVNTELFERAEEMIDYFEGKVPAKIIEQDLKDNNLESLQLHVSEAEAMASQQEFNANDIL